jgi:hypothetical protein
MRTALRLSPGIALLSLVGCASSGGDTSGHEFPPRPDGHPILVFESAPQCAYLELGEVTAEPQRMSADQTLLADLKGSARELGGDALLEVAVDDLRRNPNVGVINQTPPPPYMNPLSAEVIRFTDPDCRT